MKQTRKQVEEDRRTLAPFAETGDMLGGSMVAEILRRDVEDRADVFGGRCTCRMTDDGDWMETGCPECDPEPWEAQP